MLAVYMKRKGTPFLHTCKKRSCNFFKKEALVQLKKNNRFHQKKKNILLSFGWIKNIIKKTCLTF